MLSIELVPDKNLSHVPCARPPEARPRRMLHGRNAAALLSKPADGPEPDRPIATIASASSSINGRHA